MASPTFDSKKIFDSLTSVAGPSATTLSEGVLWCPDYTGILQKLHFEGDDGDRFLTHGYPSRNWVFKGYLCALSLTDMIGLLNVIEGYVDESANDPTVWK